MGRPDDLQCRPGVHPGGDRQGRHRGVSAAPVPLAAAIEVFRYAEEMAIERRAHPEDDIISTLLHAEPDGEPLTDLEFKNFFTLMMVAGNETTRHTISHGLIFLTDHPEQLEDLRAIQTGSRVGHRGDPAGLRR